MKKILRLCCLGLLLANLGIAWQLLLPRSEGALWLHMLDVGQGDAMLIEVSGNQLLIDGGLGRKVIGELSAVMPFWDRRIDRVVLTHPDSDHVEGLFEVLRRYEVAQVIDYGIEENEGALAADWVAHRSASAADHVEAVRGMRIRLDADWEVAVFVPTLPFAKANDNSIVLRLEYRGECVALLTGDIEAVAERSLVSSGWSLSCPILKIGHHGSKSSTTPLFLDTVSPTYALISAGKDNRYGHPHTEVIERLMQRNITIHRTDQEGRVSIQVRPAWD